MYDLGLTSEQFYELTPAQFQALMDRHRVRLQQEDFRPAIVASTICNVNRGKDTDPFIPSMFMPSYDGDPDDGEETQEIKAKTEGMSVEELRRRLEIAFPRGEA